jgi:hypothetical protein
MDPIRHLFKDHTQMANRNTKRSTSSLITVVMQIKAQSSNFTPVRMAVIKRRGVEQVLVKMKRERSLGTLLARVQIGTIAVENCTEVQQVMGTTKNCMGTDDKFWRTEPMENSLEGHS